MMPKISVVINTLNEERNIPFALRSVQTWADEIIVVDMHSDDRTVEIAKTFGAQVYLHDRVQAFDATRAVAVSHATGDWILLLDADEVIPRSLSAELCRVASEDNADIIFISRRNYLLGAPVKHSGWGMTQDRIPRFFRRNSVRFTSQIHGFMHPNPEARSLELPKKVTLAIHHFNYLDSSHFLEKLNRYTTIEAQQAWERGKRSTRLTAMSWAFLEFANRFIRRQGFRDGWRGFYLSFFMVFYRVAIYAKLAELQAVGGRDTIESNYHAEAERILADYAPKEVV